jgi:transposase
MEVLYKRCAGLDVHKKSVKVCLFTQGEQSALRKVLRTYSTKTADLLALRDWLKEEGCSHVAM